MSLRRTPIEGTAFVEAIALIPALGAILAGVIALHGMYDAKLQAKARATHLAWLQADSGQCPSAPCSTDACDTARDDIKQGGLDEISSIDHGGHSLESFVGRVGRFFVGGVTRVNASVRTELPVSLAGGRSTQISAAALPCNTTARNTESGMSVLEHACATELGRTEYAQEACD